MEVGKLERQVQAQAALEALLHRIGDKVIFIGEGSGATMAWLATDVAPNHVACVIAVEPSGPPFGDHKVRTDKVPAGTFRGPHPFVKEDEDIETRNWEHKCTYKGSVRRYGLADIPLTYDPPVDGPTSFFEELTGVEEAAAGLVPPKASVAEEARRPIFNLAEYHCPDDPRKTAWLQTVKESDDEPVLDEDGKEYPPESQPGRMKKLVHLSKVPHAILTAHASSHAIYDWATVTFMKQAGCDVTWLKLSDKNITGNGHLMFLETNSTDIADVIHAWFTQRLEEARSVPQPQPTPALTRVTATSTPAAPPTAPPTPFASTSAADLPRSQLSSAASSLVSRALAGMAAPNLYTPARVPTTTSASTTAAPTARTSAPTTAAPTPTPAVSAPATRVSTPAPMTPGHAMLTPAVRSLALNKPIMTSSGTKPAVKSSVLNSLAITSTRTMTPQAFAAAQTSTAQPAVAQPVPLRPASAEPAPAQPSTTQSDPAQPAASQPTLSQPAAARPSPVQTVPAQRAAAQPTTAQRDVVQSV